MSLDTIDFTAINSGPMGGPPTRNGYFKVSMISVEHRVTNAGNDRLQFTLEIVEGSEKNCLIYDGFNFPSEGQNSRGLTYFKDFMGSFSVKPEKMWEFIVHMALLGEMPVENLAHCVSSSDLKSIKKMKKPSLPSSVGHCNYERPPAVDDYSQEKRYAKVAWFKPERWARLEAATREETSPQDVVATAPETVAAQPVEIERDPLLNEILSL